MASEKVACHRDAADDRFGVAANSKLVGHDRRDFLPMVGAKFFINSLAADDCELLGAWRKVKQDGVSLLSAAHTEFLETIGRAIDDLISVDVTSGDEDTDFARRPTLRLLNGLNDRSLVE